MFGFVPAEECPPAGSTLVGLTAAERKSCMRYYKKQQRKRSKKAASQSQGLPGLSPASSGLPGVTSGRSRGRWTPLKTFQGVAPSAQNNAVVSGAYEFFRGQGMSFSAAVSRAIQSTRVPSRWRSHYSKYLTGKYKGASKPPQIRTSRRSVAPRPPRRRFRASVVSETPQQEALTEYAPQPTPVSDTPMMSLPLAVDEAPSGEYPYADVYVPLYQQPAALLVGAGLIGAAFYFYSKKKG